MNQSYTRIWMRQMLRSRARKVLGVQLYKNNAQALLQRILSTLNSDWLQHALKVCSYYNAMLLHSAVSHEVIFVQN